MGGVQVSDYYQKKIGDLPGQIDALKAEVEEDYPIPRLVVQMTAGLFEERQQLARESGRQGAYEWAALTLRDEAAKAFGKHDDSTAAILRDAADRMEGLRQIAQTAIERRAARIAALGDEVIKLETGEGVVR